MTMQQNLLTAILGIIDYCITCITFIIWHGCTQPLATSRLPNYGSLTLLYRMSNPHFKYMPFY